MSRRDFPGVTLLVSSGSVYPTEQSKRGSCRFNFAKPPNKMPQFSFKVEFLGGGHHVKINMPKLPLFVVHILMGVFIISVYQEWTARKGIVLSSNVSQIAEIFFGYREVLLLPRFPIVPVFQGRFSQFNKESGPCCEILGIDSCRCC